MDIDRDVEPRAEYHDNRHSDVTSLLKLADKKLDEASTFTSFYYELSPFINETLVHFGRWISSDGYNMTLSTKLRTYERTLNLYTNKFIETMRVRDEAFSVWSRLYIENGNKTPEDKDAALKIVVHANLYNEQCFKFKADIIDVMENILVVARHHPKIVLKARTVLYEFELHERESQHPWTLADPFFRSLPGGTRPS